MAMETKARLRLKSLDTAAKLSEERQQSTAALAAEGGRRWAEVARVARLSEEMDRLSLVTGGLIEERNQENRNGPRCIATFHLLHLPLLRCLLLLLIKLFYIPYEGASLFFWSPEMLQALGLWSLNEADDGCCQFPPLWLVEKNEIHTLRTTVNGHRCSRYRL